MEQWCWGAGFDTFCDEHRPLRTSQIRQQMHQAVASLVVVKAQMQHDVCALNNRAANIHTTMDLLNCIPGSCAAKKASVGFRMCFKVVGSLGPSMIIRGAHVYTLPANWGATSCRRMPMTVEDQLRQSKTWPPSMPANASRGSALSRYSVQDHEDKCLQINAQTA